MAMKMSKKNLIITYYLLVFSLTILTIHGSKEKPDHSVSSALSLNKSNQVFDPLWTYQIALGDFDDDGDLDAIFSNMGENGSTVWLNDGKRYFIDSGQKLTNWGHGVGAEDLNIDGDLDIFVENFIEGRNKVWFNHHIQALKIVSWNLQNFSGNTGIERIDAFRIVLDAIDPDILIAQEMESFDAVSLFLNEVLNQSKNVYKKVRFFDGPDTDNAAFYKKKNLKLISTKQIPTSLRDITEYRFKIKKGPGKGEKIRIYSAHFKEGQSVSDQQQRAKETQILRAYLDGFASYSPFIVCGSLNFYGSSEDGFKILTNDSGDTDGRVIDPIDKLGKWHDRKQFSRLHTQSTRKKTYGGGSTGGLDDRFDMILISTGLENNEKLAYVPGSYLTFGNDGKHFNKAVNKPQNKIVTKVMADALYEASDHLPVFIKLLPLQNDIKNGIVAFASESTGNGDIYVMDADGRNIRRVTTHDQVDYWPSWSPDGTRLAFGSILNGNVDIYAINVDGSNRTRLTTHPSVDFEPAWSPDGKHIAWSSQRDGNAEIYGMNADGTDQVRLTNHPAVDVCPSWSPDGARIAFTTNRDGNWEVYVVDADGANQTRITNSESNEIMTVWSPCSDKFLFVSDREGNEELYIMDVDGSGVTRMTYNEATDMEPSWSPNETHIIFASNRSGNHEIYIMEISKDLKPGNISRLTENSFGDEHPVWIEKSGTNFKLLY